MIASPQVLNQTAVDEIIDRIKVLVEQHGASNPILQNIRIWYATFKRCPESGSFVILEKAVEEVEKLSV